MPQAERKMAPRKQTNNAKAGGSLMAPRKSQANAPNRSASPMSILESLSRTLPDGPQRNRKQTNGNAAAQVNRTLSHMNRCSHVASGVRLFSSILGNGHPWRSPDGITALRKLAESRLICCQCLPDNFRIVDHSPGISVSLHVEHNNSLEMGNSSAHRLGERYFFALICNRTDRCIF